MSPLHVVGAAITQGNQCLVAQRGPHGSLAGKWEFPGGKVEPGESPSAALACEMTEELGLSITVGPFLARGTATIGPRPISLDIYAATITPRDRPHHRTPRTRPDRLGHRRGAEQVRLGGSRRAVSVGGRRMAAWHSDSPVAPPTTQTCEPSSRAPIRTSLDTLARVPVP